MPSFIRSVVLSAGLVAMASTAVAQDAARDNVMVVFDGSNSMWGQIDGTAKIEIARDVMGTLLGEWTEGRAVGLMAYGHRRRGDCGDIETLVAPGVNARADILRRVNGITHTGKTPLTDAVERAARELAYTDRPATVVLVSDGLESCDRDPCALARALEQSGVAFTAHVVGFGIGADQDDTSLSCIAEETGGTYIQAGNAAELEAAMSSVSTAMAEAPEPVAEPVAESEPEPEPALPEVIVTGPGTAVGGSEIEVTWASTVEPPDYITIVPAGTEEGKYGPYASVGRAESVRLNVPGDEGLYEIRYVYHDGDVTLGRDALAVSPPQVMLSAPDTVLTGAAFAVGWQPTINPGDYVTIVPAGADPGSYGSYLTVRTEAQGTLTAAADPGLYEVRYVLKVDERTLASRPIEVALPEVALTVPGTALTGAYVPVSWTGTVNSQDYITIVPAGTAEGEYGNYFVVRDHSEDQLQAPAETGLYEVRYLLREGGRTLARAAIEIVAPEVTVSAPASVATGARFTVSWTGTVNHNDYVTIVPAGTPEGEYGNYVVVRDKTEKDLQAPAEPGRYEVRYVLREGRRTLARAAIEIVAPEVTLSAPATALAGAAVPVSWTGAVSTGDYVAIVPVGADEGEFGNYVTVRDKTEKNLRAPAVPGLYEVRYILREGGRTLVSTPIEIVEPEVTVSGPDQVRATDTLRVTWTGTVDPGDYIALAPMGSGDDDRSNYFAIRDKTVRDMTAPETTGLYELRYILREGGRVLARRPVEVLDKDAPLDTGATLSAPETAAAGSRVAVSWQSDSASADRRITLAVPDQAIFTWISATRIAGAEPVEIALPEAPGAYELRLLDVTNKAVLARRMIAVE